MGTYQVAVIGGGPGGYVCAIRAAQLGLKTVIIEKYKNLGGTCLNIGCIPSKALLASSEHYHYAQHRFALHGILVKEIGLDIPAMMKRKQSVVDTLARGVDFLMKKHKIDVVKGTASIIDAKTIRVKLQNGSTQDVETEKIVIATGSVPVELPFLKYVDGHVVNSEQALAFEKAPQTMLVVGAGAIGLELGSVWARLGTKVKVIEFLPRIAPGFDLEVSKGLQRSLEKMGIEFHLSTQVKSSEVKAGSVSLMVSNEDGESQLEAEMVLVAVGRKPYYEGLGLDKLGVEITEKSRIKIDDHWQTSVSNIYAIGDVVRGPMLAHKAEEEGTALAEHLASKLSHVNYDIIPGVIYTSPEVASVGLTEEDAKEKGIPYKIGKFPFTANGRALAGDTADGGFVKLIAHAETDRLLGAHILAVGASELIAECVSVMEFGGSAEDIARTIHAHPTMAEAIKGAAEAMG
jgi:dihydrolipoamide dehydrogenase